MNIPVPYTLEQAAQLGVFPSHLDLRFLHATQAVETHLLLIAAASLLLLDLLFDVELSLSVATLLSGLILTLFNEDDDPPSM